MYRQRCKYKVTRALVASNKLGQRLGIKNKP